MTPGQELALDQTKRVARSSNGAVEILRVHEPTEDIQSLRIELSLYCGDMRRVPGGLPIRDRERVTISVGRDFPYDDPTVIVSHTRFAGYPHVNWSHFLCLYQAPQTEWSPRQGMFALLGRLELWFRQAALDQLDATGGPLHPPVTYSARGPLMIPRQNAPVGEGELWCGFAELDLVSGHRVDITGWSPINHAEAERLVGAAILLDQAMPLEFPNKLGDLLRCLEQRNVPLATVFDVILAVLRHNPEGTPLFVILGTPMRGTRGAELRQHLTGWRVDSFVADIVDLEAKVAQTEAGARELGADEIEGNAAEIRCQVVELFKRWADKADVTWCRMREDRPEVTTRRDSGRPANAFAGQFVEVWGCGALGGYLAEWVVRAGAAKVVLRDQGTVTPGILVRQPYTDADIGRGKAIVLAERLRAIRKDCEIEAFTEDVLSTPLGENTFGESPDLVIDATASNLVLTKAEKVWRYHPAVRTTIASVAIDGKAERLLAVLAKADHSGGPLDVVRKMKTAACGDPRLTAFAEAFFPDPPPPPFQPEPGCSDATFVGSAADAALLSATAANTIALMLQKVSSETAHGCFLTGSSDQTVEHRMSFAADLVFHDPGSDYETRIDSAAWRSINASTRESERIRGDEVEAGGLLFGEMDEHLKVVWVSEASGPPPDSRHSAEEFVCGIEGSVELNEEKTARTRKSVQYIGTWHTHPVSPAFPSIRDLGAMDILLTQSPVPTERLLMMIVGHTTSSPEFSATVFLRDEFESLRNTGSLVREFSHPQPSPAETPPQRRVGIALSGGGSRAMAFHLGCLRALHDRGVLNQAAVLSTVSGGSVIGAMYAYSDDTFDEFEQRVRAVLRTGLFWGLVRRTFLSPRLLGIIGTKAIAGLIANITFLTRFVLGTIESLLPRDSKARGLISQRLQPPFRRWVTRTQAFEQTLRDLLFGSTKVKDKRRENLDVVINACELRTGTAFRFGSRESGSWRFGVIDGNEVEVATAVAASAAYPALLPAIDRYFEFVSRQNEHRRDRVILTDGGVYENLGISCMTPDRSDAFSTNVYQPPYIICCDAGPGQFDDVVMPYGWMTRMRRSFEATFRQTQHGLQKQLHLWKQYGAIEGFVYAYLGQQDKRLPVVPSDLIKREDVVSYPTDFSPMSEKDIDLLSRRGEQLTRMLIEYYCPTL